AAPAAGADPPRQGAWPLERPGTSMRRRVRRAGATAPGPGSTGPGRPRGERLDRPPVGVRKRKPAGLLTCRFRTAGVPGLEPRLTGPEPVGLPITPYPIAVSQARPRACAV